MECDGGEPERVRYDGKWTGVGWVGMGTATGEERLGFGALGHIKYGRRILIFKVLINSPQPLNKSKK